MSQASESGVQVQCEETSSVLRSLSIEVPEKRVKKAFDKAYKELAKTANIRGFRKGKTPRSVLQRMYGASVPDEIERVLVSETLPEAIEKAEVMPVSPPDIDAERPEEGAPFRYTARVEVKPEIELPDLSGLAARRPKIEVTDEEVQQELERLQERHAALVEEDEETVSDEGHTVTIDFAGSVDGVAFEGGTGEGMDVEIGAGRMVPGFEDQLKGHKAGDDCTVEVTFPDDYGNDALAGKHAVFECKVQAVRRRQRPELDDEFAKDLGEYDTLADFRARLRDDLAKQREDSAEKVLHDSILDSLIERVPFEVPPGIVNRQLQSQMQQMQQRFQGQVPDEVLHGQLERMREEGRPMAERRVREALLLEAIAEAQGLEVGEADVEARLSEMAEAQGMELDAVRNMAQTQGWLDAVELELRDKAVYQMLVSTAEVVEFDPAAELAEVDDEADPVSG